mmetsp:Transcript_25741/g.65453  ORF Transcript_25741/g.65453 Transcript_25741/m.65453 type:complete len:246 (-) Transcript_25741:165-902(-)
MCIKRLPPARLLGRSGSRRRQHRHCYLLHLLQRAIPVSATQHQRWHTSQEALQPPPGVLVLVHAGLLARVLRQLVRLELQVRVHWVGSSSSPSLCAVNLCSHQDAVRPHLQPQQAGKLAGGIHLGAWGRTSAQRLKLVAIVHEAVRVRELLLLPLDNVQVQGATVQAAVYCPAVIQVKRCAKDLVQVVPEAANVGLRQQLPSCLHRQSCPHDDFHWGALSAWLAYKCSWVPLIEVCWQLRVLVCV